MPTHPSPLIASDHGLACLPVPWELVPVVRDFLSIRGCDATLCVDPAARAAHLLLWPGADPERAVDLLRSLGPRHATAGAWAEPDEGVDPILVFTRGSYPPPGRRSA